MQRTTHDAGCEFTIPDQLVLWSDPIPPTLVLKLSPRQRLVDKKLTAEELPRLDNLAGRGVSTPPM